MSALDAQWRKSSRSNGSGSCVEVRLIDRRVEVRDTKLGERSPILGFTADEWKAFVGGAKDGEFDL